MSQKVFAEYAHKYLEYGFAVFPCNREKKPKTKHGCLDAAGTIEQIRKWSAVWPDSSIGIATGAVSGVWVLDLDGPLGQAWLEQKEAEYGPLPATPEVQTGKGRHIYFRMPDGVDIRNSADDLNKVDVRGNGGYVIAPPSIHPNGKTYNWHPERRPSKMEFAYAPDWLAAQVTGKTYKAPPARVETPKPAVPEQAARYVQKAYTDELEILRSTGEGGRNHQLNKTAFALSQFIGQGVSEAQVKADLTAACEANGLWSENPKECEKTIASGMAAGVAQPRTLPELRTTEQSKQKPKKEKPAPRENPYLSVVQPDGTIPKFDWTSLYVKNADMKPKAKSVQNALVTLEYHPQIAGALTHDLFADKVYFAKCPPWEDRKTFKPRLIRDEDAISCTAWLEDEDRCGTSLSPSQVYGCMITVAQKAGFDPAIEYLDSLVWDGERRLASWLKDYCEAEDNDYTSAVGVKFLVGAVMRVYEPGCKVDALPIFEGHQGAGKSSLLRVLGTWNERSFFTDQLDDISKTDGLMQMAGFVLIELAEIDVLYKSEASAIKKFITRQVDHYRSPYAKTVVERKRRCVLAGTVNPGANGYLKDPTGARRFWPVKVGKIDLDGIRAVNEQLWAEAIAEYRAGEKNWMDTPELQALAAIEQGARYEQDPWEDIIDKLIEEKERGWQNFPSTEKEGISREEIMDRIGLRPEKWGRVEAKRVSDHMKSRGYQNFKRYRPTPYANPVNRFHKTTN